MMRNRQGGVLVWALAGLAGLGLAPLAAAQPTFSLDGQGPTVRTPIPDSFFTLPIGADDILCGPVGGPPIGLPAMGPLPPPGMVINGDPAPLLPPVLRTLGLVPGQGRTAEIDALSYGRDTGTFIHFSVDEYAVGHPGVPAQPPNVRTEGATGAAEAAADIFRDLVGLLGRQLPPGLPPLASPAGNTAVLDGNGMAPSGRPGFGLVEPNPPTRGNPMDPGDNLDALDIDTTPADLVGRIYFSLDSAFRDPLEGAPPNTGSAAANGFAGGDVLVNPGPGAANFVYAAAAVLGLDLAGRDTDDLDALALFDGDGVPDQFNPRTDILLFSVRRGSAITRAVSGTAFLDSLWRLPIEEGDILVPPGTFGIPGPTPGILIPAEWLGLSTLRSGGPLPYGPFSDDLDALDMGVPEPATLALAALGALGALLGRRRSAPSR